MYNLFSHNHDDDDGNELEIKIIQYYYYYCCMYILLKNRNTYIHSHSCTYKRIDILTYMYVCLIVFDVYQQVCYVYNNTNNNNNDNNSKQK